MSPTSRKHSSHLTPDLGLVNVGRSKKLVVVVVLLAPALTACKPSGAHHGDTLVTFVRILVIAAEASAAYLRHTYYKYPTTKA